MQFLRCKYCLNSLNLGLPRGGRRDASLHQKKDKPKSFIRPTFTGYYAY